MFVFFCFFLVSCTQIITILRGCTHDTRYNYNNQPTTTTMDIINLSVCYSFFAISEVHWGKQIIREKKAVSSEKERKCLQQRWQQQQKRLRNNNNKSCKIN